MTTRRQSIASPSTTAMLSLWINRGLELLWLLAAFLTPLAFLDPNTAISETSIAYLEVPKIALLRTLAALMAALWLIQWGIHGRLPFVALLGGPGPRFQPGEWLPRVRGWLRDRPSRWLLLAAWFFLGTTLLSTVLSGSLEVSLWGEVPGQDGYPAYTVVAYVLLFAVIATHLKTKAQLWRLTGAIAVMGTLVAGYAIFQHYGHDFFNLIEQTGGGKSEVSVFMGNSLFAGATLMMVVPITLVAAVLSVGGRQWTPAWSWHSLKPLVLSLAVVGLWSAVLAVQFLGITFTFARGPWVGTVAALAGFLGLAALFAGWKVAGRAALILGLTVALGVALLNGFGSISILGLGPWLSVVFALVGLLAVAAIWADWRHLGRVVLGVGLAVTLVASIALAFSWFQSDGPAADPEPGSPAAGAASAAAQVTDQLSSIKGEVLSGFVSGRATHWKVSWKLFRDRPWFEFDSLSLPWLRPLIGYGPDLFRYTYLLESPNEGLDLLPNEPDNAHNFFINHAVEQGILGLVSSLGIFAAVFIVGSFLLLRERQGYPLAHKLILIGLLATLGGRFLEMMVGVARVSDLTVLWVLLALFVALPQVMEGPKAVPEPDPPPPGRRGRRTSPSATTRTYSWSVVLRMAIVAWLVGGIGMLTWVKTVNNVRAAVTVGDTAESLSRGDFPAGLAGLDRAIELAPDISVYYDYKALIYMEYQFRSDISLEEWCRTQANMDYMNYNDCLEFPPYLLPERTYLLTEPRCSTQKDMGYRECLAFQRYWISREAVDKRPFYYRSHLGLANAAYGLRGTEYSITRDDQVTSVRLRDETVRAYRETLALVPNSWRIRNALAAAYLEAGKPEAALQPLEESLVITGDVANSSKAFLLQGLAYRDLGEPAKTVQSLQRYSLVLSPSREVTREIDRVIAMDYAGLSELDLAAAAFFRQGIAHQELGELGKSVQPLERSADAYARLGQPQAAAVSLDRLGLAYLALGKVEQSVQSLERSLELSPDGVLARQSHLLLAVVYNSLGRAEQAEEHRELGRR